MLKSGCSKVEQAFIKSHGHWLFWEVCDSKFGLAKSCLGCRVVSKGDATLVCDPVSYEFVRGSTIDYMTDIIRSAFEVRLCCRLGPFLHACAVSCEEALQCRARCTASETTHCDASKLCCTEM